jgi:hypothetical protein
MVLILLECLTLLELKTLDMRVVMVILYDRGY